jgi:hypothetical protein
MLDRPSEPIMGALAAGRAPGALVGHLQLHYPGWYQSLRYFHGQFKDQFRLEQEELSDIPGSVVSQLGTEAALPSLAF